MDKNMDYNGFAPYNMMGYDSGFVPDPNMADIYKDPIMNPIMQYEQGYMYYRYLTQQLEYKIKCKEYEKMCKLDDRNNRRVE